MKSLNHALIIGLVLLLTVVAVNAVPPSLNNFMQLYGNVQELPEQGGPFTIVAQIEDHEYETPVSNNKYGVSPTLKVYASQGLVIFFVENSLGRRRVVGNVTYVPGAVGRKDLNYSAGQDVDVVIPPDGGGADGGDGDGGGAGDGGGQDVNPPVVNAEPDNSNLSLRQKYANLTIDFEAIEDEYDDLKDDYLKAKERNQTRDIVRTGEKIEDLMDKDLDDLLEKINDLKDEADDANEDDIEDDLDDLKEDVTDLEKQIKDLLGIKDQPRRILAPAPPPVQTPAGACAYSWECSGFGVCVGGVQSQTCRRVDDCDAQQRAGAQVISTPRPQEQRACQTASSSRNDVIEDLSTQACTPYKKRCFGDDVQRCSANGQTWETVETCFTSCDAVTLSCEEETTAQTAQPSANTGGPQNWLLPLVGILALLGGMGAFFAYYVNQKKFAPLKEYITDSRLQGFSDSQIRSRVIGEGWDAQKVDKLLKK